MVIRPVALAVWLASTCAALGSVGLAQDNLPRMEEVVQSYVANKQFMGSVLVARGETILLDYVGSYELRPGVALVVTLDAGQLMTQFTGRPKVPIFAESETMFFLKVVDAQIEFIKNEKGEVTHLALHQGGQDIKGLKK